MAYFYSKQIQKHLVQFMEVFRGLDVYTGINGSGGVEAINVPVMYGSQDKVTASIVAGNTQNRMTRLPVMSAYMSDISMAPERYKGVDVEKKANYLPRGGSFPEDVTTITQLMSTPYHLGMQLCIYTSNLDTQLQLLEQILVLFNPSIQIQTSDSEFDQAKITTVTLTGIGLEENYPVGTERRVIITTLTFDMILYLQVPSLVRDEVIRKISMRMNTIGVAADISNADTIFNDLPYEVVADASVIFPPP